MVRESGGEGSPLSLKRRLQSLEKKDRAAVISEAFRVIITRIGDRSEYSPCSRARSERWADGDRAFEWARSELR
jgi:hypothetical protein